MSSASVGNVYSGINATPIPAGIMRSIHSSKIHFFLELIEHGLEKGK